MSFNLDHFREAAHVGFSILLTDSDKFRNLHSSFDEVVSTAGSHPLALVALEQSNEPLVRKVVGRGAVYGYPDIVLINQEIDDTFITFMTEKEYVGRKIAVGNDSLLYFRSKRRVEMAPTWQFQSQRILALSNEKEYASVMEIIDDLRVETRNEWYLDFFRSQCCFYLDRKQEGLDATNRVSLSLFTTQAKRNQVMSNFSSYITTSVPNSRVISYRGDKRIALTQEMIVAVDSTGMLHGGTSDERGRLSFEPIVNLGDEFKGFLVHDRTVYSSKSLFIDGILKDREPGIPYNEGYITSFHPLTINGRPGNNAEENWSEFQGVTGGIPYGEGYLFIVRITANEKYYYRFVYLEGDNARCTLPFFVDPLGQVDIVSLSFIDGEFVLSYYNLLTKTSCIAYYTPETIDSFVNGESSEE